MPNIEEWRAINGGAYDVSSFGRVRHGARVIRPFRQRNGYWSITLGRRQRCLVHRLVAAAFVADCSDERAEVNHRDGDKSNNAASNLEWVTHRQNHRHAVDTGLRPSGERSRLAKLTAAQVADIRRAHAQKEGGYIKLGRRFGMSSTAIAHIIRRETWAREH